jgi:DNA-binding NtrC family response regulator
LLRVLQEREFERVGDTTPIKTDVRVIATTNQDLAEKIDSGAFRQDLYYRLNVVRLDVPPLRDRREDLPLLIDHFRKHFNAAMDKDIGGLAPDALEILVDHSWPGNVRELENCIERAYVVCREPEIQVRHLPPEIRDGSAAGAGGSGSKTEAAASRGQPARQTLAREEIVAVLNQTDWNVAKSAKRLGVARNTLYLRMKHLGLSRPADD